LVGGAVVKSQTKGAAARSIGDRLKLVDRIMRIPSLYLFDLSRDGNTAVIASNHTGSLQLCALNTRREGPLRPLSHGKERVSGASISHDDREVAFSRDFGGREEHQLFRVPLRGGKETQIAHLPPVRIFDFSWSTRDDAIAFCGSTREFNGVWRLDPATGASQDLFRCRHWTFGAEWSPDGGGIVCSAKTTELPTAAELVFLRSDGRGDPELYTPRDGSENTGPLWHPTEDRVLFKTDARGKYELATYDRNDGTLSYISAGKRGGVDFPVFDWMPNGDAVHYLAEREGRTRLYVEPLDGSEAARVVPLPEGWHASILGRSLRVASSGEFAVFAWSSLSSPPAVSRQSLKGGKITTLRRYASTVPLGRAEHVAYRTFDGRSIHGWFVKPTRGRGRKPCVLWIHGGPAWEVADEWNAAIQAFAVAGYPVFAPNIRGSTGYGADFQNLNIHDVGGGDLKDVAYAVRYLRKRPEVDPKRIAIVGASYGGYMTFLAMTKLPDLWAAGAAIVGITDWREMYDLSDAAFRSFIERYFGRPEENPDLYRDRSPIHFVKDVRAPLLIWHRGNDSRVPLKPVEKFAERMRSLQKRYEMTVVWDEGHGIQKTKNLARQYKAVVGFLDRELAA
jgi:dipeptidyl aminopeptidase/acylaminoacyl peptidase